MAAVSIVAMIDHSIVDTSSARSPSSAKSAARLAMDLSENALISRTAFWSVLARKLTKTLKNCGQRSKTEMMAAILACKLSTVERFSGGVAVLSAGADQSSRTAAYSSSFEPK